MILFVLRESWKYVVKSMFGFNILYVFFKYVLFKKTSIKDDNDRISFIKSCIDDAWNNRSRLIFPLSYAQIMSIRGMSSDKNRHLLNNLCSTSNINYLEIGVWQGSTFIASNYKNNLNAIAIDNWIQFNGPSEQFHKNCKKYLPNTNYKFFDGDCFAFDKSNIKKKIDIYFFDGEHSYESQYKAFTYYNDVLADTFIAIVDDYNAPDVQRGTQDAFKKLNYKVLYEIHLPASKNADKELWWNGFYVALIKK